MIRNFLFFLSIFMAFESLKSQNFEYSDTIMFEGGYRFSIGDLNYYGRFRIDSSVFNNSKKMYSKCYDGINEFTDKVIYGKCFVFWSYKSTDNNHVISNNDTNKINLILYNDNEGNHIKTVYLNLDGTLQHIFYNKKE